MLIQQFPSWLTMTNHRNLSCTVLSILWLTSKFPRRVRRTSEAGHRGRLRVVRRSWMKFSNSGLKSSSSLLEQHLGVWKDRWPIVTQTGEGKVLPFCVSSFPLATNTSNLQLYFPSFFPKAQPLLLNILKFGYVAHFFKNFERKLLPVVTARLYDCVI